MTALSLEIYARLLAQLACRRGVRMEKILAEFGVTDDELREAEPALRRELADALERRKGIAAMKFAASIGAELARLGPIGGHGGEQPEAPRRDEPAMPLHDSEKATPSYLQAPPQASTWQQAPSALVTPSIVPPWAAHGPLAGESGPASLPEKSALPAASPAVAQEVHGEAPSLSKPFAGTMDTDLSAIVAAIQSGALPFSDPSPSRAVAKEVRGEASSTGEPRMKSLGGTMDADLSTIIAAIKSGELPFAAQASSPSDVESTDLALLPLETYASVSGALARGESRNEVLAKHRLSLEMFERLARAWALRFQREPYLLERFKDLARNKK